MDNDTGIRMTGPITRRNLLKTTGLLAGAALLNTSTHLSGAERTMNKYKYCLNTGTIRGQELGIVKEIQIAKEAGYQAIEPWIRDINKYKNEGGKLSDLKKMIEDSGMTVDSAIGFSQWIVNDPVKRKEGLEEAKRDMDVLKQIGGTRIAAPPAGATKIHYKDLVTIGQRYRKLLELGVEMGVIPQVEVWGFSKTMSQLAETVFVAISSGHPQACVLPDVYHLYKGGSDFASLNILNGQVIHVFHLNDYPTSIPISKINDADRVYPGDGDAPWKQILGILDSNNFEGTFSLELFNREYWKQDALQVAKTGLHKMKSVVANVLGNA